MNQTNVNLVYKDVKYVQIIFHVKLVNQVTLLRDITILLISNIVENAINVIYHVKPVFIVRTSAKSVLKDIRKKGGSVNHN